MLVSEAFTEFDIAHVRENKPSTRDWYRRRIEIFIQRHGDVPIDTITKKDLRKYRAELVDEASEQTGKPRADATIYGYMRAVKRLCTWLTDEGELAENPSAAITLSKPERDGPPKAISEEDIHRLIDATEDLRDEAIVRFLSLSGARIGGLTSLRVEHVDIADREAIVTEKGNNIRTVYFDEESAAVLRAYLEERPPAEDDSFFLTKTRPYRGISRSGVQTLLKRLGKRAGCTGPHGPHAFRHRYARELLRNGTSLERVSELLGHSDIETTSDYYGCWEKSELKDTYDKYCPSI